MSLTVKVARSRVSGRGMPGVGDPGIFGTIGGILSKVAGVARVIPGPIGWAATAVSRLTQPVRQPVPSSQPPGVLIEPTLGTLPSIPIPSGRQMPQMPTPTTLGAIQRFLPGGETGYQDAPPIGAPSGYHVNKTAYFLKDGTFVPEGSRWVRNRKRNPLNPRAASRAVGRIEALKRATSRFSRITIRKKCA